MWVIVSPLANRLGEAVRSVRIAFRQGDLAFRSSTPTQTACGRKARLDVEKEFVPGQCRIFLNDHWRTILLRLGQGHH